MTDHPAKHKDSLLRLLFISLGCIVGVFLAMRFLTPPKPASFVTAGSLPTQARWHESVWYWLETPEKAKARLMRADSSGARPLVEADQLTSYALDAGKIAWIARDGKTWKITLSALNGTNPQTVWSGDTTPRGLYISGDKLYYLEQTPPVIPNSGALPPLGSRLRILALPVTGGTPAEIASLLESEGDEIAGVHDGQLYVKAFRTGVPGATVIFRVPVSGGTPKRIVGEAGRQSVLMTRDGTLYWTAASPEDSRANNAFCVRRLGKDDKPETLTDWLPANGRLFETRRGLVYVDGDYQPTAWPLSGARELPHPLYTLRDYGVVAAGDGELLLRQMYKPQSDFSLYRIGIP